MEVLNKLSSPLFMADMSVSISEVGARILLRPELGTDAESDSLEERSYSERSSSVRTMECSEILFWRFPRAISVAL